MALFKKKNSDGDDGKDPKGQPEGFQPDPEKAQKWFTHARAMADSANHQTALFYYGQGIKFDPGTMSAHEAMLECAVKHAKTGDKTTIGKDIKKLDDGSDVGKFAAAELTWLTDFTNASLALKALEAAVKADQHEWGAWIAARMCNIVMKHKKLTKSMALQAKDLFAAVQAWNEAMAAGQKALEIDPRDSDLDAELKNLSAQRAMSQGGYEQAAGKEGGFRAFVKDADKQQELIEQDSISGGATVEERNLARKKAAYEEDPNVPENINSYALELKKRGDVDSLKLAQQVFMKGFEAIGEYRFRMSAGDIRMQLIRQQERAINEKLKESPDDAELQAKRAEIRTKRLDLEAAEFGERVEKYPTNQEMKHHFGEVLMELERYDEAMACFQSSKQEPKLRVRAGHRLARCFAHEGWHSEAIEEYREALRSPDISDAQQELQIKYDLMLSLLEHAREEQSADIADEAKTICSEIARKDITYRDIRQKRKDVDELIKSMR
ncbi:MAG: hypothetical protein AAF432_09175 [Planctomycetota bacterium]